tara:strand:+ start:682 stop:1188 length:507 start_codon:yes stop_codon:yes gene_type:complete
MNLALIEQYKELHSTSVYGKTSEQDAAMYSKIIKSEGYKSILDFGCGQSMLVKNLRAPKVARYDPAIAELSKIPDGRFDCVICSDVMEHILEEDVPEIFEQIQSKSDDCIFTIHVGEANLSLPDGRNCHVTVKPFSWWLEQIMEYWKEGSVHRAMNPRFTIIAKGVRS